MRYTPRMPEKSNPAPLLWVDIETTGLEPGKDYILEIGLVVTDLDLEITAEKSWVLPLSASTFAARADLDVMEMHVGSGLWRDVAKKQADLAQDPGRHSRGVIVDEIRSWTFRHTRRRGGPMAGSSVHFDRAFLEAAPVFRCLLSSWSHRNLDVSSIGFVADLWSSGCTPDLPREHRALPDLHRSIKLLWAYRRAWLGAFEPVLGGTEPAATASPSRIERRTLEGC